MTLAQKVFLRLYEARSKFVHGEKGSVKLLLTTRDEAPPLLSLASTVYRTALMAYLEEHWPEAPTSLTDNAPLREVLKHAVRESFFPYEDHLLKAIGKSYWD